jgi:uncharacterized protein (DUF4415 family)
MVVRKISHSSHGTRRQAVLQTMMSSEQENKNDKLTSIRIRHSTLERFRRQGYWRSSADEILRGMLYRIETCRCSPPFGRRVSQ